MFYDTHTHLNFDEFAQDLPEAIARAKAAGITRMIVVGTDLQSSVHAVKLAEQYDELFAVVGWHPTTAVDAPDDIRPLFRPLLKHPKVVALGETGLDNYRLPNNENGGNQALRHKEAQRRLFIQHLELAAETGLNLVIHHRQALDDVLALMEPFREKVQGQFHCFVGTAEELNRILACGNVVSFTGILTYPKAGGVRETFLAAPLGRVMFETDCPYLAPASKRGKRCEPADLLETVHLAAGLKKMALAEIGQASCEVARRFFPKLY